MMKKLMIAIVAAGMALSATTARAQLFSKKSVQGKMESSAYMMGAVPEVAGEVRFEKEFDAPGRSAEQIFRALQQWASLRYMAGTESGKWTDDGYYKNLEYARATADAQQGTIDCQGNEEMVFTNRTLSKDYCTVAYSLELQVNGSHVSAALHNIVYTYNLTDEPSRIPAEEWITDAEAISRKGELYRTSGKFRIKTIDLANQLFTEIEAAAKQ